MVNTADILRWMLFLCLIGMLVFAVLFLQKRKLSTFSYVLWGLLAIMLPILGPYLVIAMRPGEPR